jgi:23S rRNA A2030 N6-methylase RlmJ
LISKEEYAEIMSKWNDKQKKFLRIYMIWWPVQTLVLMYFFFFTVNKAHVIHVLKVFPEIISPASPYGPKGYFLAVLYTWGIIAGILPVALTIRKYIKKRGDDYSIQPR